MSDFGEINQMVQEDCEVLAKSKKKMIKRPIRTIPDSIGIDNDMEQYRKFAKAKKFYSTICFEQDDHISTGSSSSIEGPNQVIEVRADIEHVANEQIGNAVGDGSVHSIGPIELPIQAVEDIETVGTTATKQTARRINRNVPQPKKSNTIKEKTIEKKRISRTTCSFDHVKKTMEQLHNDNIHGQRIRKRPKLYRSLFPADEEISNADKMHSTIIELFKYVDSVADCVLKFEKVIDV